jgi:hypothetical protein
VRRKEMEVDFWPSTPVSGYSWEQSLYPPAAAFLQEKISQGLNHQEMGGALHHKGLSCGNGLLIHCSYAIIDVGGGIAKSMHQEMKKCEPILCFHVHVVYLLM